MKKQIAHLLKDILKELGIEDIAPQIEQPGDPSHGDYSTNVALVAAKKLNKSPRDLAQTIKEKMENGKWKMENIDKIETAGQGFINFWISKDILLDSLIEKDSEILLNNMDPRFHGDDKTVGRKVVVEYSSPNIAKPFTIGHLRSTIIGDAVASLLEATGWTVYRDNHVGDWGTQFGKQIYAIKAWGSEEEIENAERPVKVLVDLYVRFHDEAEKDPSLEDKAREWFKKLEDGDSEARRLWQKCIDWSWKEFDQIYQQLGVTFTENNGKGYGESYFENKMAGVIKELKDKGLLKAGKEGAQIIEFEAGTKLPPLMIVKKDGASLYATRDLATDKFRLENYGEEVTIINEVGAEQEMYFRQLIELEQILGWIKPEQKVHIKHGLYRFKEGKMSTRKGNVIWLEDVLYEAIERAMVLVQRKDDRADASTGHTLSEIEMKQVAEMVGLGAIKWNDLKRDSKQDIAFDWDDILNMEGNSGPYLQYTYARTRSVLRRAEGIGDRVEGMANSKPYALSSKLEAEELLLLRLLYKFDESVVAAAEKYSPNILCNYLYELAQQFNLFYQKHSILNPSAPHPDPLPKEREEDSGKGEGNATRQFRLALTAKTGAVIQHGLHLLGIQTPEKM